MNAPDFLAEKQRQFPPADNWSRLGDHLWNTLRSRIPSFVTDMRDEGRLAVGVTSEEEPRIYVRYLPDRAYAIVVHQDLFHLIYRLARAATSQIALQAGGMELPATVDDRRLTQVVADILWWFETTGSIFGPSYGINEHQVQLAGEIASQAECFLIAHEIGHIVVHPGGEEIPQDLIERLISGSFVGFLPPEADAWDEEHFADAIAFDLVMGVSNRQVSPLGFQNQLRYAGIEVMLLIQYALEELGFRVSETHPEAARRLELIRTRARAISKDDQAYENLTRIARIYENIFVNVVRRRHEPDQDRAFYAEEADKAVEDLRRALHKCSAGNPPDYFAFSEAMAEILGRGYYHIVLERMALYIRELAPPSIEDALKGELEQMAGGSVSPEQLALVKSFRMYKLMLQYLSGQDNPVGWYMMQVITGRSAAAARGAGSTR